MSIVKRGTVLLVDDDDLFREGLADIIADWSYSCICASGGSQAFEVLKKHPVDLVLLDMKMPEMNGIEVLQEIKRSYPELKVIMMTAYSTQVEEALQMGAIKVLSKPLDMAQLLDLLEKKAKKAVVLLIEDDPEFCQRFQRMLFDRNFVVVSARSIDETMKLLERQSPDIVILQIDLGQENKLKAIKRLRREMPDLPLLAVANYGEETGLPRQESGEKAIVYFTRSTKDQDVQDILSSLF